MSRVAWVDQGECISCGLCVGSIPAVFRFDENNKAVFLGLNGVPEAIIQAEAIDICPVSCIHWRE